MNFLLAIIAKEKWTSILLAKTFNIGLILVMHMVVVRSWLDKAIDVYDFYV